MQNTIHFVLQAKGGIGKSFVSALLAQYLLQQTGAEAILLRHRVDPEAPALHKRELRGNVKCVGGKQEYGEQQIDDGVDHC